ncbi:MAG: mechanosensitive ion channel [Saprospiraceae bacterium]|nr:mechanosensitive ion channel [Saprospiraceae bacterium]
MNRLPKTHLPTSSLYGLLTMLLSLGFAIGMYGQEPMESTQPIVPISFSDIPARAVSESTLLEQAQAFLDRSRVFDQLETDLLNGEQQINERLVSLNPALQVASSRQALGEIEKDWLDVEKDMRSLEAELLDRIGIVEQQLIRLGTSRDVWQLTLDTVERATIPDEVRNLTTTTKTDLDQTFASMQLLHNRVLALQGRVGQALGAIREALDKIETEKDGLLDNIFNRERPAMWSEAVTGVTFQQLRTRASNELTNWWTELKEIVKNESDRVGFQTFLIILATLILYRVRKTARSWSEADPSVALGMQVFEQPLALATMVMLVLTPWIYSSHSPVLEDAMGLLLLIPVVLLVRPLLSKKVRPALYLLAGIYVIDWLRDLVEAAPLLARFILIFELLLAITVVLWLIRSKTLNGADSTGVEKGWNQRIRFGLFTALFLLVASVFAVVSGFMRLGLLVGYGVLNSAYFAVLLIAILQASDAIIALILHSQLLQAINLVKARTQELRKKIRNIISTAAGFLWLVVTLRLFALWDDIWVGVKGVVFAELQAGSLQISLADIFAFVITILVAFLIARLILVVLDEDVYPRLNLGRGVAFAISALIKYTIITIGFLLAIGAMGIGMDKITILLGAFGVGLGFGLQTIVNSFVSGMILVFERPIQIGDSIEIGSVKGIVKKIGIRSTLIRSFDGADIIVPNGDLLSDALINWTMADRSRRIEINVGVAYGSDPNSVIDLLHKALEGQEGILDKPAPQVIFNGFGDNSLDFALRAWVQDNDQFVVLRSKLALAVNQILTENNIEIPFPQRDLHIKTIAPEVDRKQLDDVLAS